MNKRIMELRQYILNKNHHKLRQKELGDLSVEFSRQGLTHTQRF
jgi:hypothetical protein